MVCPVPYACAPTYHPSSGSHGQLFRPCWASSAWHSQAIKEPESSCFITQLRGMASTLRMPCGPTRPKELSMAATARVIRLCACVRYWPYRGVVLCDPCTLNCVSDLLFTYVNRCCWCRRCLQRSYQHRRATTEQRSYESLGDKYV